MNKTLSICIPTFNRSKYLSDNLNRLIELCRPMEIPIYISDNNSNDETAEVVKNANYKYDFIFYKCLKSNVGIDENMDSVVNMSKTKYCWLFSDDDEMHCGSIEYIYNILIDETPNFVITSHLLKDINSKQLIKVEWLNDANNNSSISVSPKALLEKHAVSMTLLSACIVDTELWKTINIKDYKSKYYFHIFNIFSYLNNSKKVVVVGKPLFTRYAGNSWSFPSSDISKIVPFYYPLTIDKLPRRYSYASKYRGIKNKKNARISITHLLILRKQNAIKYTKFPSSYFPLSGVLFPIFILILVSPRQIAAIALQILKAIKLIVRGK